MQNWNRALAEAVRAIDALQHWDAEQSLVQHGVAFASDAFWPQSFLYHAEEYRRLAPAS